MVNFLYYRIMLKFQLFFVFVIVLLTHSESAKILGIFPVTGRSHYEAGSTLMKILAKHGHEVTVVSPFEEKNPPKNYKSIVFTGSKQTRDINLFDVSVNMLIFPIAIMNHADAIVEDSFNNTNFQDLMNSGEHFDLVIMEQVNIEAPKYIAYHFKAPLIVYSTLEPNEWVNPYQGNPDNPSCNPMLMLPYTNEMTFLQRVRNTVSYAWRYLVRVLLHQPSQNILLHRYYPDAPQLSEISNNVSLVFVNTNPSSHEPAPRVPSIIDIGGFHIKKPKPLPKDLQDILDKAKNGVIYFSMGSNLKVKDMPKDKFEMFLKTFGKLKQTVIWKFEEDNLPGKPDNVIIRKWLPQNDLLAHKNIKLFITHGGIFSTMEAIYHETPLLMIPIFADQVTNSNRAQAAGFAKWLDFKTMSQEELESSLMDLLKNPKYKKNIKKRSLIFNDKPITAEETINYWVDYVIRHKGAQHLRVAATNLNWFQYVLLDVILFIAVVMYIIFYILSYCIKFSQRLGIKSEMKIKQH